MIFLNYRGQGFLETLLCLPLLMVFIFAIATLSYRGVIFHVANYQLHEALICESDSLNKSCKAELQSRLRRVLFSRAPTEIQIVRATAELRGRITIQLRPTLQIEQTLARRL